MARIPYPEPAALQPETQELLAKLGDEPINIFRMLAGGEGLLRAFSRFGNHLLFKTELDPVLWTRTLATVAIDVTERSLDVRADGPCGHRFLPVEQPA